MAHQVGLGESPTSIARRYGISRNALIAANPAKQTVMVGPQRTFRSLRAGERLNIPGTLGSLGAPAASALSAPHAMIQQGSPSSGDVVLWQTIIGVTPDGAFGPNTKAATQAWQTAHGLTADGIVGPLTWKAAGAGPAGAAAAAAPVFSAPSPAAQVAAGATVALTAAAAAAALASDPNYCMNVAKSGTPVNAGVHNFKSAWNAANPGNPLPINTGKYEPVVASALSSALGGQTVAPGCGAVAAPATPIMTAPAPAVVPVVTPVPAASVPSAVAALVGYNPCDPSNAQFVCQAQAVLGVTQDGKYGADTAAAAQRVFPGAPAGCSPRPSWWSPTGQSNCAGAARPPVAAPPVVTAPSPTASAPQASAPAGSTTTTNITTPAASKVSTGALVAGAIGAVGIVGLVALAMTSKKSAGAHRSGARKSGKRKPSKKSAHKKSTHKKKRH